MYLIVCPGCTFFYQLYAVAIFVVGELLALQYPVSRVGVVVCGLDSGVVIEPVEGVILEALVLVAADVGPAGDVAGFIIVQGALAIAECKAFEPAVGIVGFGIGGAVCPLPAGDTACGIVLDVFDEGLLVDADV